MNEIVSPLADETGAAARVSTRAPGFTGRAGTARNRV